MPGMGRMPPNVMGGETGARSDGGSKTAASALNQAAGQNAQGDIVAVTGMDPVSSHARGDIHSCISWMGRRRHRPRWAHMRYAFASSVV